MKVLLIDNFDSFTFNLYQQIGALAEVRVVRNNEIPFDELEAGVFSHIVISPGPGNPTDEAYFGGNRRVIADFHRRIPILGICLGHQGIGAYFGASVVKAPAVLHGKTSTFAHSRQGIMRGLPAEITVMRYHSLVVDAAMLPEELAVDAVADDGSIMAFHHQEFPTFGLQFHPESFRTDDGAQLIVNFLQEQVA